MSLQIKQVEGLQPELDGKKNLNGFSNRTDSTIGMNAANFEISPAVSTFEFWINGTALSKSSTQFVAITADQALTYVFFDSSGVLQKSTSIWDFLSDTVLVATVYKDGSNYSVTEERHRADHDRAWHNWAHYSISTRYISGLTGSFTNTTFSVAQGVVADEDIFFDTVSVKTVCQLWYRNTGLTAMRTVFARTVPYMDTVGDGSGVLRYDNNGTLTDASANRFVNAYVYATGDAAYPIVALVGQEQHTNLANAQGEAFPSILMSTGEWKLLYRVTFKNSGGTVTYVEDEDFRFQSSGPVIDGGSLTHAGLTGRDAANSHPALATTPDTTNFGNNLSSADDTVQKALDTLDDMSVGGGDVLDILSFTFNNDQAVLTTGVQEAAMCAVPYDCTIQSVEMFGSPSGSIVVDIWKDSYANYPPTVADTITAGAKPTISSGVKSKDTILTGWTKTLLASDILLLNIDSVTNMTWAKLILRVVRT